MPRAGISLGSNLGDRLANLQAARDRLRTISSPGEPFLAASIYETEPENCPPGSQRFYNSVLEFDFAGDAWSLLTQTRLIEKELGREAVRERNAPRRIDLDLLYLGSETISSDCLTLPHPRIVTRRFVLEPLAEIQPDFILPGQAESVAVLLNRLPPTTPAPIRYSW